MNDDNGPVCDCTCQHCMTGTCVCFGPDTAYRPVWKMDLADADRAQ